MQYRILFYQLPNEKGGTLKKKTLETLLYAAIFCLAVWLRFQFLGTSPLTESEADAALKAFQLSEGLNVLLDAQAGYVLLTSVLFYFLKSTEFWARFLPALAGSVLVFSPLLYCKQLGHLPAVLLAAGLAIDPALVISSRMADGSIFGITFLLFALGFLLNGHAAMAGIFTALALMGGQTAWFGMCIFLLAAAVWFVIKKISRVENLPNAETAWKFKWKSFAAGLVITAVLGFSIFMTVPEGLGAIFSGLAAFAAGWASSQGLSIGTALWSLLLYEGLPLLIGLIAAALAVQQKEMPAKILTIVSIAALILIIAYPERGFSLFPWLSIPLWALLSRYLLPGCTMNDVEKFPFFSLLAVILAISIFALQNLKGMFTGSAMETGSMQLRAASFLGSLLIIILATGFAVWAWSVNTAIKALFGAIFILLLAFNTSTNWHIIQSPREGKQEVWLYESFKDQDLFTRTVSDYTEWNIGSGHQSTVMISGIESGAVDWSLRMADKIEHVQALPETFTPEMVVTSSSGQLSLESEYSGQDFILSSQPVWKGLNAFNWLRWYFVRETPHVDQTILLWVRVDQFPGYKANELLPTNQP